MSCWLEEEKSLTTEDTEAQRKIGTQGKLTFDGEEEISAASIIRAPVFLVAYT